MKLIIEATGTIERVQVRRDADNSQFEKELKEIEVRRELASFDMRMVL